jgi:hypothetical protein
MYDTYFCILKSIIFGIEWDFEFISDSFQTEGIYTNVVISELF